MTTRVYIVESRYRAEALDLQRALAQRGFYDFRLAAYAEVREARAAYAWRFSAALDMATVRALLECIVDGAFMARTLRTVRTERPEGASAKRYTGAAAFAPCNVY
jgi:hypothetical protein